MGLGKRRVGSTSHKPFFDSILGTQPRLHFLPLAITLQPWGCGGAREEKGRIYRPQTFLRLYSRDASATALPACTITLQPLGDVVGLGKRSVGSTSHKPFLDSILGTQLRLHFLPLTIIIIIIIITIIIGWCLRFAQPAQLCTNIPPELAAPHPPSPSPSSSSHSSSSSL